MNKDKYFRIILFSLALVICFPFDVVAKCREGQISVDKGGVHSSTNVNGVPTSDNSYTFQGSGDNTDSPLFCVIPGAQAGTNRDYSCIDDNANYDFSNCTDSKSGPCILAGAVQELYGGEYGTTGNWAAIDEIGVTLFRLWAAAVNDPNFNPGKHGDAYKNAAAHIQEQASIPGASIDSSIISQYLNDYDKDPYVQAAVDAIFKSMQGVEINNATNVYSKLPQETKNEDGSYTFDFGTGNNISEGTVESVIVNPKSGDDNSNTTANRNESRKYVLGFIPRIDAAKSNLISWIYPSLTGYSFNKVKESNNDSSKIYAYDEDNIIADLDKKYISLASGDGITVSGGKVNISSSAINAACKGNAGGSISITVSAQSDYIVDKINFYKSDNCASCQLYGSVDSYANPVNIPLSIICPENITDPCEEDPTLPECLEPDCEEDPTLPGCEPDCEEDPTLPGCEPDCEEDPTLPGCEPDCEEDPTLPGCEPDCETDPTLPGCPEDPSNTQCSLGGPSGGLTCGPSVIEDPKMCAIINSDAQQYVKASNSYCTVYCREKLEFNFMDKETAQAGRYFRHHLGGATDFYTVTVEGTRECASAIDYDGWKRDFIAINKSILNLWNTLKRDEALLQKEPQKSSGGGCSTSCDSHPDVEGFTYKWGEQAYSISVDDGGSGSTTPAVASESKSGTEAECKETSEKTCGPNDTPDEDDKCYECKGSSSDAKPLSQSEIEAIQKRHNSDAATYDGLIKRREKMLGDIYACSLGWKEFYSPGSGSFDISGKSTPSTSNPGKPSTDLGLPAYSIEGSASASYDEESACDEGISIGELGQSGGAGGGGDLKVGQTEDYCASCGDPKFVTKAETDRLVYWNCSGSLTGAKCVGTDLKNIVPNNYIVQKTETASLNFRQDKSFSTEIFTGKLVSGGSSASIPLPEHSWPICTNRETGGYNIYIDINIGSPSKGGSVTCDYEVVNETTHYDCDDDIGVHVKECYDCDDPATPENECNLPGTNPDDPSNDNVDLGFYFRSIDLREVFPGATYSPNGTLLNPNRPIGSNWNTANAIQVVRRIENLEKTLGTLTQQPEYVVTLTPALRRKISNNNRDIYKGDYFIAPNTGNGALKCNGQTLYCSSSWLDVDLRNMVGNEESFVRNDNYDDSPKLYKGKE